MFVLYTRFDKHLSKEKLLPIINRLPRDFALEVFSYTNLRDQYRRILGRFLLMKGLTMLQCNLKLTELKYTSYGRPYFTKEVDFSISHSDEVIVCIVSSVCKVGIDIERNKIFGDLDAYSDMFTNRDWKTIVSEGYMTFYDYWTKKEAIMKADGRGISKTFAELEVTSKNVFLLGDQQWYPIKLDLFDSYTCYLACNLENAEFSTIEIKLNEN